MIITKKLMVKAFYDYTKIVYRQCGMTISKSNELKMKHDLEKFAKEYTLFRVLKKKIADRKARKNDNRGSKTNN